MTLGIEGFHGQSLSRTSVCTGAAAIAVERRNLNAEFIIFEAFADGFFGLEAFRAVGFFFSRQEVRTDDSMRADQGAAVTLNALIDIPFRNLGSDAAFFVLRRAERIGTVSVRNEFADRNRIANLKVRRFDDVLNEIRNVARIFDDRIGREVFPFCRNFDFNEVRDAAVDSCLVHGNDLFAFREVGLSDSVFHMFNSIIDGHDVSQFEEGCLEDRIGTVAAETDFFGDLSRIDDVEFNVVCSQLAFNLVAEVVGNIRFIPVAVEQEDAAFFDFADDVIGVHVSLFMTCQEVSRFYVVRSPDRFGAKAQVRFGNAAGFLGIVFEVSLDVHIGVVADDLDGVLVGTDSTVRTEAPELAADRPFRIDGNRDIRHGKMGYVIDDAQGEVVLRLEGFHVVEYGVDGCRRNVFRRQAIATGQNSNVLFDVRYSSANIFVKRFAQSTRFFRAVHNGDRADRIRHSFHEVFEGERAIETYLEEADFFAVFAEFIDRFLDCAGNGTHSDDDVFSIGSPVVIEEVVRTARQFTDLIHVVLNNVRQTLVPEVVSFAGLEEHIRVGNGTAHDRMFRIEARVFEIIKCFAVDQFAQFFGRQHLNLLNFVRRPETVKEVHERYAAFDRCQVSDSSEVSTFLNAGTAEHGPTGVATAHNVRMVTEDRHGMGPYRTSCDVQDDRFQFTGQTVHDRDHQHEALRCRKGGTEAARFGSAVSGTDSTGFGLHFNQLNGLAE